MAAATVVMAALGEDLALMLAVVGVLVVTAALVVLAALFPVALVKQAPMVLEAAAAAVVLAVVLTPLDLAAVSVCWAKELTVLAAPVVVQMDSVVLEVLAEKMRRYRTTMKVTHLVQAIVAAVVVALITPMLSKLTAVLVVSASSGGPTGLSPALTPETCNSHGY
jgi:hypothetical protein